MGQRFKFGHFFSGENASGESHRIIDAGGVLDVDAGVGAAGDDAGDQTRSARQIEAEGTLAVDEGFGAAKTISFETPVGGVDICIGGKRGADKGMTDQERVAIALKPETAPAIAFFGIKQMVIAGKEIAWNGGLSVREPNISLIVG